MIVAATGVGKTVISSFDYKDFCRENKNAKNKLLLSYQKLLHYYTPKILLGLTATPERNDGQDILLEKAKLKMELLCHIRILVLVNM